MIIETIQINEKNTREVQTKDGAKLVSTIFLYPFGYIGNNWVPSCSTWGDYVTVIVESVKKEEKGDKTYYNTKSGRVVPLFELSKGSQAQEPSFNDMNGLFGGSEPLEVSDSDLPF